MRAHAKSIFVAPLVVALVCSAGAEGQSVPSPFAFLERKQEAGFFTGHLSSNTGRFDIAPSGGLLLGGRYAVELTGPLSLEGVLGLMPGERNIVNPARVIGDQVIGQADVLLTMIEARLRFSFVGDRSWNGLSPFLAFGGGVVFDAAATPELDAALEPADVFDFGTSFLGSVGAGTRWFLTDAFAIRADGLFSFYSVDTPPGFSDPARGFERVEESQWLSSLGFSIALVYRW